MATAFRSILADCDEIGRKAVTRQSEAVEKPGAVAATTAPNSIPLLRRGEIQQPSLRIDPKAGLFSC